MAGKQVAGDGLTANLTGLSKNQIYEIMCQMKMLVEQNQQQARQILIQNPGLTKALFQAQIMLGMMQPPQAVPTIQSTGSPNLHPLASERPLSSVLSSPSLPGKNYMQDQPKLQQQKQPAPMAPSASLPPSNIQSQSLPSHPSLSVQQPKGRIGSQLTPISLSQSSQSVPHHSVSQLPSHLQPQMPSTSSHLELPIQTSGNQHLPMQQQLPPQVRPSIQPFPRQIHPHMGSNVGFPQSGAPLPHHSRPGFHPATKPPASTGPFWPGQPPVPSQLPSQPLYQMGGGSHLRTEFSQAGSSMQTDRGSSWIPGIPENTQGTPQPGPLPFPGQMGTSNQPSRPPALSPDTEKALLQQVMSLTAEQINMLPPEQRNQVLQLQQMLRQ